MFASPETQLPKPAMNPYQKRASNSYKSVSQSGLSDREAMAEAFRVMIHNLTQAREAFVNKAFDMMLAYNMKTIKILDVLKEELAGSEALSTPEAIPAARFHLYTYRTCLVRLTDVLTATRPVDEFNAMIEMLKPLYKAWLPQAPDASTDDAAANTQSQISSRI